MGTLVFFAFLLISRVYTSTYSTNFTSYDSKNWILATNCMHCADKKQCTQESVNAITFNPENGSIITTLPLNKATECGALCESGHMTYVPDLLYCHIKVIAKWYPYQSINNKNETQTAEGFIGFDSASNVASITFGFHGDNINWPYNFTTDSYANHNITPTNPIHHQTKYNLAQDLNTFEIIWTQE
eukprot:UN06422